MARVLHQANRILNAAVTMLRMLRDVHRIRPQKIVLLALILCTIGARGQNSRVWVMNESGSIVEYDPSTFAPLRTEAVPAEAVRAPRVLQINAHGQMLFAPNPNDPSPDVGKNGEPVWFWDGKSASETGRESLRTVSNTGSNQRVVESFPNAVLSADGMRFYWFTNEFSRLERDGVELAVTTTFRAWSTDVSGKERQEVASFDIPECKCPTGSCSETCQEANVWTPEDGVTDYFLLTRLVPGQTGSRSIVTSVYHADRGAWHANDLAEPLQRILDAGDEGAVIVNAIPDTGCCGWENQSNDQTILLNHGRKTVIFDEREQYKNPDYDVSFYTTRARLSPDLAAVAMTIEASARPGSPIQLSDDGQGNPAESLRIRKALTELPAVQIMSVKEPGKRLAFVPHASLAGWLNDKEVLLVENQALTAYNIETAARRKSTIKVSNPAFVFVR
jgi:hypothetical protein